MLNILCTLLCRLILLFLDIELQTLLRRSELVCVIELLSPEPQILFLPSNAFPTHKLTRRCPLLSLSSNSHEMADLLTSLHDLLAFCLFCSSNNLSGFLSSHSPFCVMEAKANLNALMEDHGKRSICQWKSHWGGGDFLPHSGLLWSFLLKVNHSLDDSQKLR